MVLINRESESLYALDMDNDAENTVLVNTNDSNRWTSNGKARIAEFYGFEGDDLRFFIHSLDSFFALNGITSDSRKVAILKSQLRRVASVFFENPLKEKGTTVHKISYMDAVKLLQDRFVSEATIEIYRSAFDEMYQVKGESPSEYLSRLYEGADLGNISDESAIYSRFRSGLSRPIKVFFKEQASNSFQDWIKNANAWWNAHSYRAVQLVDNPFNNNDEVLRGKVSENLGPVTVKRGRGEAQRSKYGDIRKFQEAYAGEESPTMAELSAKLEALELNSLIPVWGDNGKADIARLDRSSNSSRSDNGALKTFIKNIVCQELSNNGKSNATSYKRNGPRSENKWIRRPDPRYPFLEEPIHPGYTSPTDYGYEKFTYDAARKIGDAHRAEEARNARINQASRYPPRYRNNYERNYRPNRDGYYNNFDNGPNQFNNGNSGYQGYNGAYNGNQGYHNGNQGYGNDNFAPNYGNGNGNQPNTDNQHVPPSQPHNGQPPSYNAPNRGQGNGNNYEQGKYNGSNYNQYGNKNSYHRKEYNNSKN